MCNANKRDRDATPALPLVDELLLWEAARVGDAQARERLIEAYLPFARVLAAKLYAGRIDSDQEFDEYLQFATVGLIESVDRYDPSKQTLFRTFAGHRINGAVLSGLEHLSEKREQIATRQCLLAERRNSGDASPPPADKAVFQQLADIAIGLAIGYLLDDCSVPQHDDAFVPANQYTRLELRQLQERIRALVEGLPQRERMVIKYHYLNHVPFNLIAEILALSRGRVSQIHRHGLELLREMAKSVKACDVAW